jgi:succinate dehydrogenase / fumarate reductase cytochrome b subunit
VSSPRTGAFASSIVTKLVIGVSGLFLVLYLFVHIAGNLVVFGGAELFNAYSHMLAGNPLIKVIEVVLVIGFVTHIYRTIAMFVANRRARPVAYVRTKGAGPPSRKTLASSTMIVSGVWLLVFLVLHVKAFKFSPMYEYADGVPDLYRLEMDNFRSPFVTGFYVLSMLVVGSHLWHGVASGFQSLGLAHPRVTRIIMTVGKAVAILIPAAFIVIAIWAHRAGAGS